MDVAGSDAAEGMPMKRENCTRVNLPRGTHAHLVPSVKVHDDTHPALCGFSPRGVSVEVYWEGPYTPEQYERAAALPLCVRCHDAVIHPAVS
jgi:hypothetical protein